MDTNQTQKGNFSVNDFENEKNSATDDIQPEPAAEITPIDALTDSPVSTQTNTSDEVQNGATAPSIEATPAQIPIVPYSVPNSKRLNRAEELNNALFSPAKTELEHSEKSLNKFDKRFKSILKRAGVLVLVFLIAFTGAFYGMAWVCKTAILGDSDFFQTLIIKNSGIKVNRVELDYISGEYISDTVTLANTVLDSTVEIRLYEFNDITGFYNETSNGSGVIFSEDGLIITNDHVVNDAKLLKVVLRNGKSYKGEVLHLDSATDLAVVKIEPDEPLTPVKAVSDSSKAVTGQQIVVAGNPLGTGLCATFGYISHPDRKLSGNNYGNFIQIDATVNPGNSGGGLFDTQGNLLGIVSAKATGDNVDGIGYVIPSNRMLEVVNDLLEFGYVKNRPAIGLSVVTVAVSTWDYFNAGELNGFLSDRVYGVYITASNFYSELRKGDRIVSVNGHKITVKEELSYIISEHKVGDEIEFEIDRPSLQSDGTMKHETFTVKLALKERDWPDTLPTPLPDGE